MFTNKYSVLYCIHGHQAEAIVVSKTPTRPEVTMRNLDDDLRIKGELLGSHYDPVLGSMEWYLGSSSGEPPRMFIKICRDDGYDITMHEVEQQKCTWRRTLFGWRSTSAVKHGSHIKEALDSAGQGSHPAS